VNDIQFSWHRRPAAPVAHRLRRLVNGALRSLGVDGAEIHVLMTGDEQVKALNSQYRRRDEATDVLSFPDGSVLPGGARLLGQIVVSVDRARQQAPRLGHSEVREVEELVLHGLLHLMGYDHSRDTGEMDELEMRLRRELLT